MSPIHAAATEGRAQGGCPTHLAWRNGAELGGQQHLAVAHGDAGQLPVGELDVVLLFEIVGHRHLLARSLIQELFLQERQARQAGKPRKADRQANRRVDGLARQLYAPMGLLACHGDG
jgi:hypothetical protein